MLSADNVDEVNKLIHKNLKHIMKKEEVKQENVARLLGISVGSMNRLVNGRALKLAEIFILKEIYLPNYSLDELIKPFPVDDYQECSGCKRERPKTDFYKEDKVYKTCEICRGYYYEKKKS